jgi:photosystem II stability/assembly factor-like uncharacterized protein
MKCNHLIYNMREIIIKIMIHIILLILTVFVAAGYSQGNWELLVPSGTSNQLVSLYFTDGLNGCSVGQYGTIIKTSDGGITWEIIELEYLTDLTDIYFPTESVGYIVGEDGLILKTTDSGDTWDKLINAFSNNLHRIKFRNEKMGWAIGEAGLILYTSDGGESWNQQTSGGGEQLNGIEILGDQTVMIAGENNTLLMTENNGTEWNMIETNFNSGTGFNIVYHYSDIYFANDSSGWVCGQSTDLTHGIYNGFIANTNDGGKEWTLNEIRDIDYSDLNSSSSSKGGIESRFQQIFFKDDLTTGLVWLGDGFKWIANIPIQTRDGGHAWKVSIDGIYEMSNRKGRFQFLTDTAVVATGYQGDIRYSNDSGQNLYFKNNNSRFWEDFQIGPDNVLHVVRKKPIRESWEHEFNHLVSVDKGSTWNEVNSTIHYLDGSEEIIKTVSPSKMRHLGRSTLTSGSRLFAIHQKNIGDTSSSILYSDDMGVNYHELRNGVQIGISETQFWNFLTPDTLIYTSMSYDSQWLNCKTSYDGGVTIISNSFVDIWNNITTSTWNPAKINDSYYLDSHTGFIVGDDGNILKTENTGQSWTNIYSGVVERLWDIEFINRETGFVVGEFGRILKTMDGGVTWRKTDSGTQEDIYSVAFLNANDGWVGTESGLRYTTDGGESWQGVPLRYQHGAVHNIIFDTNGNGYAYTLSNNLYDNSNFIYTCSGSYVLLQRMTDPSTDIHDHQKIKQLYPEQISLYPNYPNPFNAITRIEYYLPNMGVVSLKIFNIQGQLIRTLVNQTKISGHHSATWDGNTDSGISASSGVYLYQLQCNKQTKNRKLLLLK